MGLLDAAMGSVAKTMIGSFGRAATIRRPGPAVYDPATGRTSEAGGASVACEVVLTDYAEAQVDGTLIQAGDRKALVSRLRIEGDGGSGFAPMANTDELIEGSRTWRIVHVRGYSSGDNEAAFELQVRR